MQNAQNRRRRAYGSAPNEVGRNPKLEARHEVSLTEDYWMAVFELTQMQWCLVMNANLATHQGKALYGRPVEHVNYTVIRGTQEAFLYPKDPQSTSFLGKLRSLLKNQFRFDLPSEMQWEYACRAGTSSALYNGKNLTTDWENDPELSKLGRYRDNGGKKKIGPNEYKEDLAHARVGSYLPNAWGLYDMLGNVYEWCLDWFLADISNSDGSVCLDSSSCVHTLRGGGWVRSAGECRSAKRCDYGYPQNGYQDWGFRLVCPVKK